MNEKALDSLYDELKILLQHELKRGNRVLAVETGWSKVNLAVRLVESLDMPFINKTAENNPGPIVWGSRGIKNPQEAGVLCKSAQQTLSGWLALNN